MYTQEQMGDAVVPSSNAYLTAGSMTAAAAAYCRFLVLKPIQLKRAYLAVTTNVTAESAAFVMAVYQNLQYAVTTGQVTVCTLTVPTASTVGQVFANQAGGKMPYNFWPGQEIAFTVKTAGTSTATAAGAYLVGFDYDLQPEVPTNETANNANLTQSTLTLVTV